LSRHGADDRAGGSIAAAERIATIVAGTASVRSVRNRVSIWMLHG
jgi:hypothetical protein